MPIDIFTSKINLMTTLSRKGETTLRCLGLLGESHTNISPSTNTPIPTTYTGQIGQVILNKGMDRPGVPTHQELIDFVQKLAGLYGKPLHIGTGTAHSQSVKGTTRTSAHWAGWAVDIPRFGGNNLSPEELTKLGQEALVVAGMNPAEAATSFGGVYNIGNYQILFNTMSGGNHFTHLHIGIRGKE